MARLLLNFPSMRHLGSLLLVPFVFSTSLGVARADGPTEQAEGAIWSSIVELRAAAGVGALQRDPRLDAAALAQAEDMAEHDYVGHESDRTGTPVSRVQQVSVRAARVAENVVRADSPAEAATVLASSAAHRAEILANDITAAGIAVVEDEEGVYVVQLFTARARPDLAPPISASVPGATPGAAGIEPATVAPQAVDAADDAVDATGCEAGDGEAPVEAYDGSAEAMPIAPAPTTEGTNAQPGYPANAYGAGSYATNGYDDGQASGSYGYPGTPNGYATAPSNGTAYTAPVVAPQASAGGGGTAPTVVLQMVPPQGVQGYWVQAEGRWWFYPVTPGAGPGTVLQPAPNVTGGPVGSTTPTPYQATVSQGGAAPAAATQGVYGTTVQGYANPTYANPGVAYRRAAPTVAVRPAVPFVRPAPGRGIRQRIGMRILSRF